LVINFLIDYIFTNLNQVFIRGQYLSNPINTSLSIQSVLKQKTVHCSKTVEFLLILQQIMVVYYRGSGCCSLGLRM